MSSLPVGTLSPKFRALQEAMTKFVNEECIRAEPIFEQQLGRGEGRWKREPPVVNELRAKARALGLWNLFLPKSLYPGGHDLTNYEYGLLCEIMGRSVLGPLATNCNAPDTGNMEVLAKYGTAEQKRRWLEPLLDARIRSAFAMTEPAVASSDATNIRTSIRRDGDEQGGEVVVINGDKWWISNAGNPECKVFLVFGVSDLDNSDPHRRHTVVIVPADTPGVEVKRPMTVYGYDDAPYGHCEVSFVDVRVPVSNIVLGEGRGFEVIQGRLGPGRIHHCMRAVGMAERALELMVERVQRREVFGRKLVEQGVVQDNVARSRLDIESARMMVVHAALKMDAVGTKQAMKEISMAKAQVPKLALRVVDRAIQMFGAAGVSQDTPLAAIWAGLRTLRLADGPDEVHMRQIARLEIQEQKHKARL
ncbi:hypothetical protein EV182_000243 [Spiromyces aspiralis]|uniref:Uncharacterized protein n=1 Tax=Spiromyces aspiralis TaxID=68401 RepID=A0ACC1HH58_9FUNG|nr:hypothetical protein EV182_000243 [Spiromyces aspiralis]